MSRVCAEPVGRPLRAALGRPRVSLRCVKVWAGLAERTRGHGVGAMVDERRNVVAVVSGTQQVLA
jgi:hypothetical protein